MHRLPFARHLPASKVRYRYATCRHPVEKPRWHAPWLLARTGRPRTPAEVADVVGLSAVTVRAVLDRWNAHGPDGVADRRRHDGADPKLSPRRREALYAALQGRPPDGGVWTGPKVARYVNGRWRVAVRPETGWRWRVALGFSPQVPRPAHPKAADAPTRRAVAASRGRRRGASFACPGTTSTAMAVSSSAAVRTTSVVNPPGSGRAMALGRPGRPDLFLARGAPAAWARTMVESISTRRVSPNAGSAVIASNRWWRPPEWTCRRNRLYTASRRPNSEGKSRHGTPVRATYNRASRNSRSGRTGGDPPVRRLAASTSGAIAAQRPSVSMYRMAAPPKPDARSP